MYYNMYMYKGNIVDIKNNLKYYIGLVTQGEIVTIMKRNIPVAKIIPYVSHRENKTKLGCGKDSVTFLGSLTDPLIEEDDWEMLK